MANPVNVVDLDQTQEEFETTHAQLLQQKVNRSPSVVPADSRDRVTASWMNFVDDFLRSAVGRFGSVDAAIDAVANAQGGTVVREIDYTAEESSGALSDGNLTLGGVEHTVVNVAGASQCEVIEGTGIALRYKTTGAGSLAWNGTTQTGPGIFSLNGNLIPNFSQRRRYMYQWHYSVPATWHSGDLLQFLLCALSVSSYVNSFYESLNSGVTHTRGGGRGYSVSASVLPTHAVFNGTTFGGERSELSSYLPTIPGTTVNPSPDRNAYNVIALEHINASQAAVYAGVYDGGWPDIDDLVLVGETEYSTNNNGGTAVMRSPMTRVLVGLSGGSGTADPHGVDVHRLRVLDMGG